MLHISFKDRTGALLVLVDSPSRVSGLARAPSARLTNLPDLAGQSLSQALSHIGSRAAQSGNVVQMGQAAAEAVDQGKLHLFFLSPGNAPKGHGRGYAAITLKDKPLPTMVGPGCFASSKIGGYEPDMTPGPAVAISTVPGVLGMTGRSMPIQSTLVDGVNVLFTSPSGAVDPADSLLELATQLSPYSQALSKGSGVISGLSQAADALKNGNFGDALLGAAQAVLNIVNKLPKPELIAVAGSQHDNSSGNKMMFIGQAVRELAEFKRNQPAMTRTLVVFTPSYNTTMLKAASDSAKMYEAGFVTVSSAAELIRYLNSGQDRQQAPIQQLSLFSHGVPQRIAFGYDLSVDSQLSLDVLNYSQISPQAFSPSAHIDSYACRTGMGNLPDYKIEEAVQFFPQTNESLAQLLANHLSIPVHAFIRRSDYKNTWGSFEDRRLGSLCRISDNGVPGEEWCMRWVELDKERDNNNRLYKFTYQTMGASNPVISGSTPVGIPGGHFEFLPQ